MNIPEDIVGQVFGTIKSSFKHGTNKLTKIQNEDVLCDP
jgi:hypothetical protein